MVLVGHLVWIKLGLTLLRVPACGRSVNKARLVKVNWSYHQTPFGSSTGLSTEKFLCFFTLKEESIGYTHTQISIYILWTHTDMLTASHTHSTGREMGPYRADGKWDVKGLFRYAHSCLSSSRASFILVSSTEKSTWFLLHFVLEVL